MICGESHGFKKKGKIMIKKEEKQSIEMKRKIDVGVRCVESHE